MLRELAGQFREIDRVVKSSQEAIKGFERIVSDLGRSGSGIRTLTSALELPGRRS